MFGWLFKPKRITANKYYQTPEASLIFYLAHRGFADLQICRNSSDRDVDLTSADISVLSQVSKRINASIKPRLDKGDRWVFAPEYGDCEDYAVTKIRHMPAHLSLLARLCIVKTRAGTPHMVLVVRGRNGDYVLDNLTDKVLRWDKCPHTFVAIQSDNPYNWLQ